jgi:hypothetical protein
MSAGYSTLLATSNYRIDSQKIYSKRHSLPHIKIYSKSRHCCSPGEGLEGRDEADDEATKSGHGGDGAALPPSQ